jgi:hypothetical protein
MPLSYILMRVGQKIGLNPADSTQRATLLSYVNEAARELYDQSDPSDALVEQAFKVNGDQTISCPSYVGPIRGVRELDSQIAWSLNKLRPRYNQFNWVDSWRNIRLKNIQALQCSVTNSSVGVITVPVVENPPIQVSVSGPTLTATSISETITMRSLSMQTTSEYLDYTSVKKDRVNNYDITLSDVDGKVLTVIPNNQLAAQYQIIDVSQCPWLAVSTNVMKHYVEILYKQALNELSNDLDEFVWGKKYDDVIINKSLQLYFEETKDPVSALAYDQKATRTLARRSSDLDRATEDMIAIVAHPHDALLPRIRAGRRKYYRGYGSRGYGF